MFGQDCGQAPFISKHTRPRCSGELCLLCWVTDTNMIFKQVQLYLFPFSCSTCMSTVLAKAAHSLYFWAATPKIPTAFYFDKQNQHVFAEFKQENCPRKNKTVKKYQQFEPNCSAVLSAVSPNCSAVWPNCSAVSPKLLSSFPQTAQQFPSNCSAVWPKLLAKLLSNLGKFGKFV